MNSPILGYAFLKAAYGLGLQDPIDAVQPLVERALYDQRKGNIDISKLQRGIKKYFGVEIPINVIRYTFTRIAKITDLIQLNKVTYLYERTESSKGSSDILRIEKESREQISRIKANINDIVSSFSELQIGSEEILEEWLDNSSISFLGGRVSATNISNRDSEINRIIALAVSDEAYGKSFLSDLTDVALGDALLRAIKTITEYDSEAIDSAKRIYSSKMKDVDVYFDTKLVLRALGLVNDDMQKATQELIKLCTALDAKICIFTHTVSEIKKIIKRVSSGISLGQEVIGDVANYAVQRGVSPGELLEFALQLDEKLTDLGFRITDSPEVDDSISIDEKHLDFKVATSLKQEYDEARAHDVNSLRSIYQLRGGKAKRYLESCEAIFITPNKALADTSTLFFNSHFKSEEEHNRVQHCMTDIVFATRLWTKLPTSLEKLPRNQILAHAMGNLSIKKEVKTQFHKHIEELLEEGKFTEEEVASITLSNYSDEIISLSHYPLTQTKENAESIALKLIEKQKDYINIVIDENERERLALESQIIELTDDFQRSKKELEENNQTVKSELEKMVSVGETKIKYMNQNLSRIEKQCGKISGVIVIILSVLLFIYVSSMIVHKFEVSNVFFETLEVEGGDVVLKAVDVLFTILLTLLTVLGSSFSGLNSRLTKYLKALMLRFLVGR